MFVTFVHSLYCNTMSENETTNPTLLGEIEQGPSKFDQFLDKNQKNLIIVGIGRRFRVNCPRQ